MPALISSALPSLPGTLFHLLTHSRPGLSNPADMPRIECTVRDAQIDPRWLARYRRCVGLPDDVSASLPPLALQVAVAPLHLHLIAHPRFPFRALGLVHMSQQITQNHPISLGQYLDICTYTTDARWEKRGMSFGLITEVHSSGQLVWHGETRALARLPSPVIPGNLASRKTPAKTRTIAPPMPSRHVATVRVPENTGRRYASIAGDRNPIHQHALLAKAFGFRRAIVHGTWTLARALAEAGLPARDAYTLFAQFRRPVELPSDIHILADRDSTGQRNTVVVTDANGQVHLDITLGPAKKLHRGGTKNRP